MGEKGRAKGTFKFVREGVTSCYSMCLLYFIVGGEKKGEFQGKKKLWALGKRKKRGIAVRGKDEREKKTGISAPFNEKKRKKRKEMLASD